MNCPEHPEVWLSDKEEWNQGYCEKCNKWYDLEAGDKK